MTPPTESIPSTSTYPHMRPTGDPYPLMPTSVPWLLGIYLGLPLLLTIVNNQESWSDFRDLFLTIETSTLGMGGLLQASYVWLMPRVLLRIRSPLGRLSAHAICILTVIFIGTLLVDFAIARLGLVARGRGTLYEFFIATSLASVVVLVSTTYVRLQQDRRYAKQKEHQARRVFLAAQLKVLQLRTNPQFLFNSLDTVARLIETDPDLAEATLVRLAGLFRYSLKGSHRPSVTLGEELVIVLDYLEIEQLRLGRRLRWRLNVSEELSDIQVPPLLLQPLVENAIVHGITPQKEGGQIDIRIQSEAVDVIIEVQDNNPCSADQRDTCGALEDLTRRLEMTYGKEARFDRLSDQKGHRVCIRLPKSPYLESQ